MRLRGLLRLSVLLLLLAAMQSVWASPNERIGILNISNVSGVRQGDLEKRASKALEGALRETGAQTLTEKEVMAQLNKVQLADIKDYLPVLSTGEIAKLCRRLDLDRLVTLNILGYNEFLRDGKRTFEIKLELESFTPDQEQTRVYAGDASGVKGLDSIVSEAVRESLDRQGGKTQTGVNDPLNIRSWDAPVIVNQTSGQYHLPMARHLPKFNRRLEYASRRQAENEGYPSCSICYPSYDSFFDLDRQLERELGARAAGMIQNYYRILDDPNKLARVERIANAIIPVTGRKNIRYHFNLLDTDEVNAFSLPGGLIYVSAGLLRIMESDDELAFVLSHEMVHNVRKHAITQYRLAMGMQFLSLLLIFSDNDHRDRDYFIANILNGIIQSGYSRGQEREADRLGLIYAIKSGYDPEAYQSIFGKFIDMRSREPYMIEKMFASHPGPQERLNVLRNYLDGLRALKAKLS